MELTKLKNYMHDLSLEHLKNYLGRNIVDSIIEWTPDNQILFTKSKLIDMILTVHGVNILKDNSFRKALIKTFPRETILSFLEVLSGTNKQLTNINQLVDVIAGFAWRDNNVSFKILEVLAITDNVFEKNYEEEATQYTLTSTDKFYELLDYQFVIKQRLMNNLTSGIELNRMLVHMPTGTGKTKTAVHTICNYYNFNLHKNGLVIWVAHTTELLQQAFDTFNSVWKHLGNGDINVCKLWGSHSIDESKFNYNGIVFCGVQKLISMATSAPETVSKLIEHCNLIIFDEAHKAAAPETRSVIERFMVRRLGMCDRALIGLTATPGRFTELNVGNDLLASMFGNKLITIDTEIMNYINMSKLEALNTEAEEDIISYFQNKNILAKIIKERLTYPDSLTPAELIKIKDNANNNGYNDFTKKALETIGKNKSRNLAIMRRLRELSNSNIPTIVFACSVEHGQLLASMLSLEDIPNALVIGDMAPQDRASAIQAFKNRDNPINILINYEVLTTGFDATNIRCVFIARPTQSVVLYSQMLGRGLRGPRMGGNEECLLIDVKDNLEKYNEKLAFGHFNNYWKV